MEQKYYSFLIREANSEEFEEVVTLAYTIDEAWLKGLAYINDGDELVGNGWVSDMYAECGGFDTI